MVTRTTVDIEHGEKTAQKATFIIAGLAIAKGIIGWMTNSAALLADALHSTVDVLTALGTWIGLRIARRPANEKFPYGYYHAESIVALFISAIILWGAVELFLDGVARIHNPESVEMPWLAAGMALVASVVSFYVSKMEEKAAEVSNSSALKAVSIESMADTLSSLVVFAAIVAGSCLGIPWAEGVGAILVAAWVFRIGAKTAWNAILALMDVAPAETKKKAEEILTHADEISGYKNLKLRKAGPIVFGEVTVTIPADVPVAKADEIARRIRGHILTIPEIEDFRVYVEQEEPKKKIIVIPFDNGKVARTFATAPAFSVYVVESGKIEQVEVINNDALRKRVRRGLLAAKHVLEKKPYAIIVKNIGEVSYNTLKAGLVRIYRAEGDDPEEEIRKMIGNKLEELHKATVKKE